VRLTINGEVRKRDIPDIKRAVRFYANELMSKSLVKKLKITIRFVSDIKNTAEVTWTSVSPVRPKSFLIYVNSSKKSKVKLLKTLGHELTHVKQFATGELKDLVSKSQVRWKDKLYPFPDAEPDKPETYWNAPWEIEAYGREVGLYHLYKKHITDQKRLACRNK
jgi:hypothetical protein